MNAKPEAPPAVPTHGGLQHATAPSGRSAPGVGDLPGDPAVRILLLRRAAVAAEDAILPTLAAAGYKVAEARHQEAPGLLNTLPRPDLIVLDVVQPEDDACRICRELKADERTRDVPVIFVSLSDRPCRVLDGFDAGGVDFITRPFVPDEMLVRVATHVRLYRLAQELRRKNAQLENEMGRRREAEAALLKADAELSIISEREARRWGLAAFVGRSPAFQTIVTDIRRLQKFPATSVLITGESGTGKELIARAIHYGSDLARGPFVPVNCGAIPAEIAESAIFGHVKGAFSGATGDHKGYFEQAHGGTLFLDEIGEMSLTLQVKLLRVLEDHQLVPVGGTTSRTVEARLIAGTNADLEASVGSGRFREDLYFRLARFTIQVPPLRDRRDDIPMLVAHFLRVFSAEMGVAHPAIHPATLEALQAYDYPGNIRELKNLVERALIESGGAVIGPEHLHFTRRATGRGTGPRQYASPPDSAETHRRSGEPDDGNDVDRILAFVREHGSIDNSRARRLLEVGLQRACYLLRKAYQAGLLEKTGTGRWTAYRLSSTSAPPKGTV